MAAGVECSFVLSQMACGYGPFWVAGLDDYRVKAKRKCIAVLHAGAVVGEVECDKWARISQVGVLNVAFGKKRLVSFYSERHRVFLEYAAANLPLTRVRMRVVQNGVEICSVNFRWRVLLVQMVVDRVNCGDVVKVLLLCASALRVITRGGEPEIVV
jgi:hypothetical protein